MVCLVCQDLYQRCEKMRPTLFRLASDTEDNDEALGERYFSSSVNKYHVNRLKKKEMILPLFAAEMFLVY